MTLERLQKILAHRGVASRRAAEELILAGRVRVDGETVTELGAKFDADAVIEVDGRRIDGAREPIVVLLNKPKGYTCTVSDPHAERTVMELVDEGGRRLYPVGRLDKDSRGLLLLTDDGDLAHRLLHPSVGVEKVYEVRARGTFTPQDFEKLAKGVALEDGITAPARVEEAQSGGNRVTFRIAIHEGRKRQIRLMVRALGGHVIDLKRIQFAGIELGALPEGSWRRLRPGEVGALRKRLVQSARKATKPKNPRKTGE